MIQILLDLPFEDYVDENEWFNEVLLKNHDYVDALTAYSIFSDDEFYNWFIEFVNIDYVGNSHMYFKNKVFWTQWLRIHDHDVLELFSSKLKTKEELLIVSDLLGVEFEKIRFYHDVAFLGAMKKKYIERPLLPCKQNF